MNRFQQELLKVAREAGICPECPELANSMQKVAELDQEQTQADGSTHTRNLREQTRGLFIEKLSIEGLGKIAAESGKPCVGVVPTTAVKWVELNTDGQAAIDNIKGFMNFFADVVGAIPKPKADDDVVCELSIRRRQEFRVMLNNGDE